MVINTFRQFLELAENPSHIGSLEDELGINPEDFKKVPQVAANFKIGKSGYNMSPYEVVDYVKDNTGKITGAKVKLINDPMNRLRKKTVDGNRVPDRPDNQIYYVPIDQLNKLLSQGLDTAAGGGAGATGMM
jgi:hypothetical protein